jgi:putative nucleotidyltransferase with HDIG domain
MKKKIDKIIQIFAFFKNINHSLIFLAIGLLSSFLIYSGKEDIQIDKLKIGEKIDKNIFSLFDYEIKDIEETRIKREEKEKALKDVYDFYTDSENEIISNIKSAFLPLKLKLEKNESFKDKDKQEFAQTLKINLSEEFLNNLFKEYAFESMESALLDLIEHVMEFMIISESLYVKNSSQGIMVNFYFGKDIIESKLIKNIEEILTLEMAKEKIAIWADTKNFVSNLRTKQKELIVYLAQELVRPNLFFNRHATLEAKDKLYNSVKPIIYKIKKGELIVKRNDLIDEKDIFVLNEIAKNKSELNYWVNILYITLFILLFFSFTHLFFKKFISKYNLEISDVIFLSCLVVITILLSKLYMFVANSISLNFPTNISLNFKYGIPIFTSVMLVRLIFSTSTALAFLFVLSFVMGLLAEFNAAFLGGAFYYFIFIFLSGLISISFVSSFTERINLLVSGIKLGIINIFIFIFINNFINVAPTLNQNILYNIAIIFSGGFLSGILVLGLSPLAEFLGYTTNIKLLELANTDNPILSKLAIEAPGTMHHSFIVGQLAEHAALEIGANPLIAKICALYHDIGKLEKPQYFIENQLLGENKHDKLTPRMSSLIISSHVKDGIDLAKKYNLPKLITDMIPQHHGTGLISYFYSKAKNEENPEVDAVNENDYRYTGPKPQTKEAGILMLADGVEAAARTLDDPTVSRIKGIVNMIITKYFQDGQLNECDLTFNELTKIEQSFVKVLTSSIYHHRINYPEMKKS